MAKWLFFASYLLFTAALVAIIRPHHALLSHQTGVTLATCIVIAWVLCIHWHFRQFNITLRQEIAGWCGVAALVSFLAPSAFMRYYLLGYWPSLSMSLGWQLVGLAFAVVFGGVAILLIYKEPKQTTATPYTVESEAPDHVLHIESMPNYSLKRTSAGRLG